jgi:hypothetical protein
VHVLVIAMLLQAPPGASEPRRGPPVLPGAAPAPAVDARRYVGIGIAMAGVAVVTGGVVCASISSREYQLAVDAPDAASAYSHFNLSQTAYQAGWGVGIVGVVTLLMGVVIALIPTSAWTF